MRYVLNGKNKKEIYLACCLCVIFTFISIIRFIIILMYLLRSTADNYLIFLVVRKSASLKHQVTRARA